MTNDKYIFGDPAITTAKTGRKKYSRPQGMLWSENAGTLVGGYYVPSGYEVGANLDDVEDLENTNSFLILSDDNRSEISISPQRIEQRKRMINGTMRSNFVADKLAISTSWSLLPSRSFALYPNFGIDTLPGVSAYTGTQGEFTSDGGAGGAEMLNWYETHTGPFWVFLAYDKYTNFGTDNNARLHLGEYNQVLQMYISSFTYNIIKRGGTGNSFGHDLWNINVSLEEV